MTFAFKQLRSRRLPQDCVVGAATAFLVSLFVSPAAALPGGIRSTNCPGCHGAAGTGGEIELTANGELAPGEPTQFTLTIRESQMASAGFYVFTEDAVGTFTPGEGARSIGGELVQASPIAAVDGQAQVNFEWTAPAEPGGTHFIVYSVAANGDDTPTGDPTNYAAIGFTWGCDPITLYLDIDGDGYGQDTETRLDCNERMGWSVTPGDCNDLWGNIFPMSTEIANGKDDDCDGEIDEGVEIALLYPDLDGDGFGDMFATPFEGRLGEEGYVANAYDCDDSNAAISPYAEEVCDGVDNNCNQERDEGTYEYCGVGRCSRRLELCDRECIPGTPIPEQCNGLDDDCDGVVDNDAPCPEGQVCGLFQCEPAGDGGTVTDDAGQSNESPPNQPSIGTAPLSSDTTETQSAGDAAVPERQEETTHALSAASGDKDAGDRKEEKPASSKEEESKPDSSGCTTIAGQRSPTPLGALLLTLVVGMVTRRRRRQR